MRVFQRIRRSLALKLILFSAVPSAAVLLVGLFTLINLTQEIERNDPNRGFNLLRTGSVLGALFALAFATLAVLYTTRRFLVRPAQELMRVMGRAENGEMLVRAKVDREDELGRLSRSFNKMLARITDMAVNEIESQRSVELMRRELALQSELKAANEQLAAHVREIELVLEVSQALSGTLDLPEQLEQLGREVCARLEVSAFSVLLLDEASQQLVFEAVAGGAPRSARGVKMSLGEGVTGEAVAKGETIYVPDVEKDPRYLHYKAQHRNTGSFLAVPLRSKGRVVGSMNINRPDIDAFLPGEIRLAEAIAAQAALAISNARLHAQTVELSFTDPLTGIANRRSLFVRLEQELVRALRFGDALSLLMIDLDHFKDVNDAHGHAAGDRMLHGVAQTLRNSVRKVDLVGRFGGEEFCVVLPRVALAEALEVAEKLRRAIESEPFVALDDRPPLHITISVGVASYGPGVTDASTLLDRSDEALYAAKRKGRNNVAPSVT